MYFCQNKNFRDIKSRKSCYLWGPQYGFHVEAGTVTVKYML